MSLFYSILADGFFAAIAAIGFSVISNPPRKAILISALLAAVGHAVRFYLLKYAVFDITLATLVGSFLIGLLSFLFAAIIHCPAEVFSFPSLLPMVPGMYAYKTILSLMKFLQSSDAPVRHGLILDIFSNGLTTVFVLFAMVVGVSLPLFLFHKRSFMMTRLKKTIHTVARKRRMRRRGAAVR